MMTQPPISRVNGIAFPAIPDTHASMQLALQYQFENSQWWKPEVMQSQQLRQLKMLLDHAVANVPYYQQLFQQRGLIVPNEITPEFLQHMPILTRTAIQNAEHLLEASLLPTGHVATQFSTSSGSTGRPVRFGRTGVTQTLWLAFALRDHLWHARDFSRKLCVIRWLPKGTAEPPLGVQGQHWGSAVSPVFATGPASMLSVATPLELQIKWLLQEQPHYLQSHPSNLAALAQHCLDQNIALPGLHEILTTGESITDQHRALFHRAWGVAAVDIYSCEEAGYLALQCPEFNHYHVQAENVILEIVDEQGKPCAPGQIGQVLITTLHNYATPLIRYEVGDMAEFGEPCPCGRGLPVIRKIHGRKRNRLRLPSGRSEFAYLGRSSEIEEMTGLKVRQFQYVQHSVEEIEIMLVTDRPFTEEEKSKVARQKQHNLGHPFRIVFSFHTDIPKGPTGKHEEFICKVL